MFSYHFVLCLFDLVDAKDTESRLVLTSIEG
jgi:hypothetical protein